MKIRARVRGMNRLVKSRELRVSFVLDREGGVALYSRALASEKACVFERFGARKVFCRQIRVDTQCVL